MRCEEHDYVLYDREWRICRHCDHYYRENDDRLAAQVVDGDQPAGGPAGVELGPQMKPLLGEWSARQWLGCLAYGALVYTLLVLIVWLSSGS